MTAAAKLGAVDHLAVAAQILCCPDCQTGIDATLSCQLCRRSFLPDEDGIINALPLSMGAGIDNPDEVQNLIDSAGPGEHGRNIVLYEKAFHDQQAAYYDKVFADPQPLAMYYKRLVRDQIFSYVDRQPFVIDLCCGTGKSSLPLVHQGIRVIGMDVSRRMLQTYRQKCTDNRVLLIHADASCPPLRFGTCGAIMMIGGLHHILDQSRCIDRCCNALSKNGIFIVHEPLSTGRKSSYSWLLDNLYALMTPSRVLSALKHRLRLDNPKQSSPAVAEEEQLDFTPYERPFSSPDELKALMPPAMKPVELRSQGLLSFHDFPPILQGPAAVPIARAIVKLDDYLSARRRNDWAGDTLFGAFRKST